MKGFIDTVRNNIRKIFYKDIDIRRSNDHLPVIITQILLYCFRTVQIFFQCIPQDRLDIDDRGDCNRIKKMQKNI